MRVVRAFASSSRTIARHEARREKVLATQLKGRAKAVAKGLLQRDSRRVVAAAAAAEWQPQRDYVSPPAESPGAAAEEVSSRVDADSEWHIADRSYTDSTAVESDSRFDAESRDPTAWTPDAAYEARAPQQLTFAEAARRAKAEWDGSRSGEKGARGDEESQSNNKEQEKEGTRQFGYVWYGVAFVLWYITSGAKKRRSDDGEDAEGGGGGGGATKPRRPMRRGNPRVVDGNNSDRGGRTNASGDAAEAAEAPGNTSIVDTIVRETGRSVNKYFSGVFTGARVTEHTTVRTDPKTGRLVAKTVARTTRGDGSSTITELVRDHATGKVLSHRVLSGPNGVAGAAGAGGAAGGERAGGRAVVEPSAAPRVGARAQTRTQAPAPAADARPRGRAEGVRRNAPGSKRPAGNAVSSGDALKAKREARRLKRLATRKEEALRRERRRRGEQG